VSRISKYWPLAAALAAGVIIAVAHGFQTFGHLDPCELCLKERRVYWVAIAAGVVGFSVSRVLPRSLPAVCFALALIFLGGAALSAYHAGVEWKFWAGPASCTGGGGHKVTVADMERLLRGGATAVPQCDKPAWVFLGLSMAGWNVLLSLGLAVSGLLAGQQALKSKAWRRL
jgi:disulfide bond formation protein DsbB